MVEKIIKAFLILLVGIGIGYWWRMYQVEPQIVVEFTEFQRIQSQIRKDIKRLELQILRLEKGKKMSIYF